MPRSGLCSTQLSFFFASLIWRLAQLRALNPPTILRVCQEIKSTTSGAVLRISWTKALQHREGLLLIPLPSIPGFALSLPWYISLPWFLLRHQHQCSASLQLLATVLLPSQYLLHVSNPWFLWLAHWFLQRGGATSAFQSGVPEHLIKLHGDWRFDAFRTYLALLLTSHTKVADIMDDINGGSYPQVFTQGRKKCWIWNIY